MNCLHLAVNKDYPDIVRLLLVNYSFPLNLTTNQGLSAVSIAVFRQHHQCLELLINAGADLELANSQGMTPLQLALKTRDNFAAKLLIKGGARAYYSEIERQHQSPIFYILKTQNVVMLEELNNKDADFLHTVRTSDGSSLFQYAAKAQLDEAVSYLSVICTHEELSAEDPTGFNPLMYYLAKDSWAMAAKLIFRGANVNHLYKLHGGKSALAIMVEQKNDVAVKFLLDKLANPHLVFGLGNQDACDLAKENGLDKRFFVF
jgi:ankyrin repeat protein